LGGDAAGRRLIRAAWNAARGLDSVIICPAITSVAGACDAGLDAWQLGFDAGLRAPFFLAKEVGRRFRRSGGGLVFAIDRVPRGAAALPHVIRSALLTMIDALARALPPTVAVAAVVGGRQSPAVEVARSVRLLMAEGLRASGTVLELGEPRRRG
jgi:NAD(P)-dependent dehydrogenase (short-subunit alcohol dehydrogenase family)